MTNRNSIILEQHQCPICGVLFDTGGTLFNIFKKDTLTKEDALTGHSLCPEHQTLWDEGYIAMVEVENDEDMDKIDFYSAKRTGTVAHVHINKYEELFGPMEEPDKLENKFVFVQKGIIEELKRIQRGH